jgi:outer membrane phospholipase A
VGRAGHVTILWEGVYRPPYRKEWFFLPYVMVQYFNGYSETLLTYDERTKAFRVGFGVFDVAL